MPKTTPIKVRRCKRPTTPFYVRVPDEIKQRFPLKYPQAKRFFAVKSQAQNFCNELAEVRRRMESIVSGLTEAQTFEAAECFALLEPSGRTLREAADFFLRHLDAVERSAPLAQVVEEVVEAKRRDGFTTSYIATFQSRLRTFAREQGQTIVSDFNAPKLEEWLRENVANPTTRNNYRRDLRTMFAFALTRRYVATNPVAEVGKAKQVQADVEALGVSEVSRLLHNADGVLLPLLAIGAFTGIRPEEINRLDWERVDFEHGEIDVRAGKSKTGARRLVKMSPNLLAWLATYRGRTGKVLPHFPRVRFENTRVRAGVTHWPHDALRHTYASMHLARWNDAAALALQMGHGGTELIFRHYRKVVNEREAADYWNLYPEGPLPT